MIKLTYCLRRKPGMTVEEFQRYWRETHAPLVEARAEVLGIKRYVQVHTVLPAVNAALQARNGGSPEAFDGVAELWVESVESMGSTDPAARSAIDAAWREPAQAEWLLNAVEKSKAKEYAGNVRSALRDSNALRVGP